MRLFLSEWRWCWVQGSQVMWGKQSEPCALSYSELFLLLLWVSLQDVYQLVLTVWAGGRQISCGGCCGHILLLCFWGETWDTATTRDLGIEPVVGGAILVGTEPPPQVLTLIWRGSVAVELGSNLASGSMWPLAWRRQDLPLIRRSFGSGAEADAEAKDEGNWQIMCFLMRIPQWSSHEEG